MSHFVNRAKMVGSYFLGVESWEFYPQEVVIELTNFCNLACVMCPHSKMTRAKGRMSRELYEKIIDEIAGKTELIYLYGTGESLLHKDLCEFISYARGKGLYTVVSTNGMTMDDNMSAQLLSSGLDYLIIAFDGGVKETYEGIRIKGDFDKVIANVRGLLRKKAETGSGTKICLQMIYMEENIHEIDLFKSLFTSEEKRHIDQFRFKPLYKTRAYEQKEIVHTKPCYWLWNMMTVCWNGEVAICCTDYDAACVLGDVRKQEAVDVWNSEKVKELRSKHRNLDYQGLELCSTCNIPNEGYFNFATIFGSLFLSARQVRTLLPIYEKMLFAFSGQKSKSGTEDRDD